MKTNHINFTFNTQNTNLQPKKKETSFKGYDIKPFERMIKDAYIRGIINNKDQILMNQSISSFKAFMDGLSQLNPVRIENELYKKFNIKANFYGNKIVAGCTALTANIFHKLKLVQPPMVSFKRSENDRWYGVCRWLDRGVEINSLYNWEDVQRITISERLNGSKSSGHFLAIFIHEFMHSVHFNNIYQLAKDPTYKNHAAVQKMINAVISKGNAVTEKLELGSKPFKDIGVESFVKTEVSEYGSTQPSEMFAEKGAQMIAEVLDPITIRPTHNPFAFMKFTENSYLAQMMDDIYNGKIEKYVNNA